MKVKLKKISEDAQTPKKSKEGDFCYDVYATSEEEISPGVWQYGLGLKYEIDREGDDNIVFLGDDGKQHIEPCNISIDLRCRSGIYKSGMILANAEGTLDEYYRGEAKATFYHIFPNLPRYKKGDRIGQIKIGITIPIMFEDVDEINENTERGANGFTSTGLR